MPVPAKVGSAAGIGEDEWIDRSIIGGEGRIGDELIELPQLTGLSEMAVEVEDRPVGLEQVWRTNLTKLIEHVGPE